MVSQKKNEQELQQYIKEEQTKEQKYAEALHLLPYKLLGIDENVSVYDANILLNQRLDDLTPLELVTLIAQANGRLGKLYLEKENANR